jgi:hypothetical protein
MTTPPPTAPGFGPDTTTLRLLTAGTLLAIAAVLIFFGFLRWVFPPVRLDFFQRFAPEQFTSLLVLAAPLLAVLIAIKLAPVLTHGKLIGLVAMIEYAAAFVLGALGFLLSVAGRFEDLGSGVYAFGGLLQNLGFILAILLQLGLLVLALLWTYRLYGGAGGRIPRLDRRG